MLGHHSFSFVWAKYIYVINFIVTQSASMLFTKKRKKYFCLITGFSSALEFLFLQIYEVLSEGTLISVMLTSWIPLKIFKNILLAFFCSVLGFHCFPNILPSFSPFCVLQTHMQQHTSIWLEECGDIKVNLPMNQVQTHFN